MSAIVLDSETTGFDEPEIVDVAFIHVDIKGRRVGGGFSNRYRPSKPIGYGALATHHITMADVADCPPSSSFKLPDDVEYLIGHNVDYDWGAIGKPEVKRICTLALSRSLYPSIDSHSLGAMLYFFYPGNARFLLEGAHGAVVDTLNTISVLERLLEYLSVTTFEELWEASEKARIPTIMPIGKHKDMLIADLPWDYREWVVREHREKGGFDPYLIRAIEATFKGPLL